MERFLRYSLEHRRAIRLIYMDDAGVLRQKIAVVTCLEPGVATVRTLRPPRTFSLSLDRILSADYCRGDDAQD